MIGRSLSDITIMLLAHKLGQAAGRAPAMQLTKVGTEGL